MLNIAKFLTKQIVSETTSLDGSTRESRKVLSSFPDLAKRERRTRDLAHKLIAVTFIGDAFLVLASLSLAFIIRFHTPIREIGIPASPSIFYYGGYMALAAMIFLALLTYGGVYDHRLLLSSRVNAVRVFRWSFAWVGLLLASTFMLKFEPPISRVFCIMAWVLVPTALLLWRSALRYVIRNSFLIEGLRQRVAFVGWNEETTRLVETFRRDPDSAYQAVGYFESYGGETSGRPQVRCLGNVDEFEQILASVSFDFVLWADLNCDRRSVLRLANICEREMVEFKVVPSYFQILLSGLELETIGGIPVMGVSRLPLDRIANRVIKRLLDIIGGIIGLILSVPIIATFSLIVYLESPGPIFYRQRRLGRNGKPFDIIKIRSMRLDAEKLGTPGWTVQDDPRRLKVGAFMRKWNIDEVPQFWNVLRGEMSLVGPRPERPELIANFKHDIAHYNARHNVKPGITGWAQVSGLRGNTDLAERIKYDLWYLENWSVMLDLQVMFLTLIKHKNAG
jgi:exopolysaccharide biosynthesis polyprenyl glycosylphosphotransferase